MSGYKPIYKRIWKDPDFQELDKDDKLLFIYLCTNEAVTESGVYPLTPTTVANETGISLDKVKERFNDRFFKNVIYDKEARIIFVKKMKRYGTGGRPDLIAKSILSDYASHKSKFLWEEFLKEYPDYKRLLNGCSTVVQPTDTLQLQYSIYNINNTILEDLPELKKYPAEFVNLRKLVFGGLKERRNYVSRNPSAEAKAISQMLLEKFTPDQILQAYDLIKQQLFYQDKNLSMMAVRKDIHEVLKDGKNRADNKEHGESEGTAGKDKSKFTEGRYGSKAIV